MHTTTFYNLLLYPINVWISVLLLLLVPMMANIQQFIDLVQLFATVWWIVSVVYRIDCATIGIQTERGDLNPPLPSSHPIYSFKTPLLILPV